MKMALIFCLDDIQMFMDVAPIYSLQDLKYESNRINDMLDGDIIYSFATNYPTLTSIYISTNTISDAGLLKVVECCRELENFTLGDRTHWMGLEGPDIKAISSLPRLRYLETRGYWMHVDAFFALGRFRQLKHLGVAWGEELSDILRTIGESLASLKIWGATVGAWLTIAENCRHLQNLQYLHLSGEDIDAGNLPVLNDGLKKRLRRLASLKVNDVSFRLGTDWVGYKEVSE
jgi:hypothetical protein